MWAVLVKHNLWANILTETFTSKKTVLQWVVHLVVSLQTFTWPMWKLLRYQNSNKKQRYMEGI